MINKYKNLYDLDIQIVLNNFPIFQHLNYLDYNLKIYQLINMLFHLEIMH